MHKKIKIKKYADIIRFHNKKMPTFKSLSIIMLYFAIESDGKYYPQTFFEECKYVQERVLFPSVCLEWHKYRDLIMYI